MIRRVIKFFGIPFVTIDTLEYDLTEDDEFEEITAGIGGGSTHDFERDLNPPDPLGEEPWEEEDFGFRRPR